MGCCLRKAMSKSIQKFAWKPTVVWDMQTKDFRFRIIWLCWYWDCGDDKSNIELYRLTDEDEAPITYKRYVRTNNNRWI